MKVIENTIKSVIVCPNCYKDFPSMCYSYQEGGRSYFYHTFGCCSATEEHPVKMRRIDPHIVHDCPGNTGAFFAFVLEE